MTTCPHCNGQMKKEQRRQNIISPTLTRFVCPYCRYSMTNIDRKERIINHRSEYKTNKN